jgi:hypothetical protein
MPLAGQTNKDVEGGVGDSETDKPLGWVFRKFIVCKGEGDDRLWI